MTPSQPTDEHRGGRWARHGRGPARLRGIRQPGLRHRRVTRHWHYLGRAETPASDKVVVLLAVRVIRPQRGWGGHILRRGLSEVGRTTCQEWWLVGDSIPWSAEIPRNGSETVATRTTRADLGPGIAPVGPLRPAAAAPGPTRANYYTTLCTPFVWLVRSGAYE